MYLINAWQILIHEYLRPKKEWIYFYKNKIQVGNVTIEAFCVDVDDEEDGSGKGKGAAVPQAEPQTEAGVANEEVRNKIRQLIPSFVS